MLQRTEAAVDPADELVHLVPQLLVPRGVLLRRRGDLYEHDPLRPLRILMQELLERDQLMRDSFDVVHPVDP